MVDCPSADFNSSRFMLAAISLNTKTRAWVTFPAFISVMELVYKYQITTLDCLTGLNSS